MKIVHLVSAKEWGGGEVYVMSLATEQRNHGHEVEIICANRPEVVKHFKEGGFNVHVMQIHGHINLISPLLIANIFRRYHGQALIHVHRIIDTHLVANALRLLPAARRPRFICTNHLIQQAPTAKKLDKAYSMLDKIICVSQKSKDMLLSNRSGIVPSKVTVILNSTKTIAKPKNQEDDNCKKTVSMLFMGRLYPEKGVDTIIDDMPMMPDVSLTICGKGEENYTALLHERAKKNGVDNRIEWIGFTPKVVEYISRADIGVIPSRWEEPCALVNFEFLAAGIPLVTSNTGGQPEIITDGVDGLLVAPDDPKALAAAVNSLVDNPDRRKTMGKAARETFMRRFTYDNFYKQVMAVYEAD